MDRRELEKQSNGPGMYYRDPVQSQLDKIKQDKLAKKIIRQRKEMQISKISDITNASRNRAPTIPDKNRSFGYEITQ